MKKILILFLAVIAFFVAYLQVGGKLNMPKVSTIMPGQGGSGQTQNAQTTASPSTLSIPSLGIQAPVEYVGLDAEGNMDVPKDPNDVAWYQLGYKPGQDGNAVIAGHLDTRTGAPAVFYNLKNLQIGDTVQLTDQDGKNLTFKVTDIQSYPYKEFPIERVFGSSGGSHLNLITCVGTYSTAEQSYSDRLVVYTDLVP